MTQKTTWYVVPMDSHTNKVLYRELEGPDMVYLKTDLGKTLKAYQVDHAFITELKKSKSDLHLDFKVYKRQSKNSPAKEFDFSYLTKKTKTSTKSKN